MALPFIPFESIIQRLAKLQGQPASNIKKWLFEKEKLITPNPLKPHKKKQIKEKKLDIPKLQELLINMVDRINGLIDITDQIPVLERKVWELENEVRDLTNQLDEHRNAVRQTSVGTRPVHQYFSNTSQQTTMESGGRTQPKPLTQSQRKQLIDDILKGS
jgi:hypothetical protein